MDHTLIVAEEPERPLLAHLKAGMENGAAYRPPFLLALSGGRTPEKLYALMAESSLPWESVLMVQADERIVPSGHEDRNLDMIDRLLLRRAGLGRGQIAAVDTEGDPESYAVRIGEILGRYGKEGLDAAILGLGGDGHTASVFPEEQRPMRRSEYAYLSESGGHAHRRITLSLPFLAKTTVLYLLVKGESKRQALEDLLRGEGGPAALLPGARMRIYTDLEGAAP